MQNKKVLLMYITEVSGHHSATLAIENALRIQEPSIDILNINAFHYTNPISERIVNRFYMGVIKKTPGIWDYLYDNPSIVKNTRRIKQYVHKLNSPKLKILFDRFRPQVIVCSQAFPCGMAADFKKTYNLNIPLIGVLTDHAPHSFWIYDNVDYYITPSQDTKNGFIRKGVPAQRIKTLGIPIDPKFAKHHNKEEIAKKMGLDLKIPIVLLMGGGQGIGPIKKIIKYLDRTGANFQIVVIAGTNKKLLNKLKNNHKNYKKKITIFAYVDNIDELMEVSKLVISKAGGMTTSEALAKDLPLVIIKPIPGQEELNTEFLLRCGAAIKIIKTKEIISVIERLLNDAEKLKKMSLNAKRLGKPNASFDIADLILKLCSNTTDIE